MLPTFVASSPNVAHMSQHVNVKGQQCQNTCGTQMLTRVQWPLAIGLIAAHTVKTWQSMAEISDMLDN